MPVGHVAEQAAVKGNQPSEPCEAHGASRSESEPDTASKRNLRVASLPEMVKPARSVKTQARATDRLSGVGGGSAYRESDEGT